MGEWKKHVTISLSYDTVERLKQIAKDRHTTVSQLICDLAWATPASTDERSENIKERVFDVYEKD